MSNRIISVNTSSLHKLVDIYRILDVIAEAGYRHFDLTLTWDTIANNLNIRDDWEEEVAKLRKHADDLGLKCIQSHVFYCSGTDEATMQKRTKLITRGLMVTKAMGAEMAVIHPMWEYGLEDNVEFLKSFLPILEKENLKLAIENVWGGGDLPSVMCSSRPELMEELLGKLNDDHYVVCLDIGHAELGSLNTCALDFVNRLGNRIKTLHIHDNHKEWDLHQIPYFETIDFDAIFKELKTVGYEGPVNFEVNRPYFNMPLVLYPAVLRFLKEIGGYFASILDD